ncbi:RNA polymerase sigma-70 factor [Flavobacterium quisquiliarum]|uniref:RNA polymerase sigma-70 factor n=1 Tax=Flavobacterium quisquiliarum TaxID=1834436 RepID=A0ABV8VZ59_9FLAO|nr:RNA polymerase sigma-70 factor [Flavobacterium quisquiliarum]MBW1656027.1 RNA polymerase sigma-70 factor [Flavobacterium quisquiliarum]NWL01284.1 RNA polymerase sigma-70 factor [Flavobacterium collinsii]
MKTLTSKEYKYIFDSMYTSLCLFANKYIENLEASQDLVQDVFIKIWEEKIVFTNDKAIKSYLYTAVKNQSLDYLKSAYVRTTKSLDVEDISKWETDQFFHSEVVISDTNHILENAITALPEKCAQVIRLSMKGMTNPEIAEELEISINTIKLQKKIAYKRLRPLLKDYFFLFAFIAELKN